MTPLKIFTLPGSPQPRRGWRVTSGFWFKAGLQASAIVNMRGDGTAAIVITGSVDIVAHGPFGQKQRDEVTFTEYGEFVTDPMAKSPL